MYAQHWGLEQEPFSIAPDPQYLFMSLRHREALAHLLYGVAGPSTDTRAGGGFVLLTGDIGTGKTTVCRCFLAQIPNHCQVAYIFNPKLSVLELLQTVCQEFHIELDGTGAVPASVKTYVDALNNFLLRSHALGRSSVLIIDEAQNLQADVLEQLRLLTNLETNTRKLLQIVLIGQPELRGMLETPAMEQLAQRVIARYHLTSLSADETCQYIAHRLGVAGHHGPLPFNRRALASIHRLTGGVPRRINLLCARSLLGAWANGLDQVDATVVKRAAQEVFGHNTGPKFLGLARPVASRFGFAAVVVLCALAGAWWGGLFPQSESRSVTTGKTASASGTAALPSGAFARGATLTEPTAVPHPPGTNAAPAVGESTETVYAVVPQLPNHIDDAWRTLALYQKLPVDSQKPCETATQPPLQCVRSDKLTLPLLRQLGRAGILTLVAPDDTASYAVLVGLDAQRARLQMADGVSTVALSALMRQWRGQFATYWQPPPGYNAAASGTAPAMLYQTIGRQLDQAEGLSATAATTHSTLDTVLRARVQAFQRSNGLVPDGLPGPWTLMQLDIASGTPVPTAARLLPDSGLSANP